MGVYHLKRKEGDFKVEININGKVLPNLIFMTNCIFIEIQYFRDFAKSKKILYNI